MEIRGYAVRHCVRLPQCFDCASTVSLSHMAGQVRRRSIAAESKIKCHDLHSRRGSHSGRFDRLLLARHETAYERGCCLNLYLLTTPSGAANVLSQILDSGSMLNVR